MCANHTFYELKRLREYLRDQNLYFKRKKKFDMSKCHILKSTRFTTYVLKRKNFIWKFGGVPRNARAEPGYNLMFKSRILRLISREFQCFKAERPRPKCPREREERLGFGRSEKFMSRQVFSVPGDVLTSFWALNLTWATEAGFCRMIVLRSSFDRFLAKLFN